MDGRFVLFVFCLFNCLFLFAFVCWHGHWAMGNILLLLKMPTITIISPVFANYLLISPQDEIPEADVVSDDGGSGDGGDVCEVKFSSDIISSDNFQFFSLLHCVKNPSLYLSFQYFSISFSTTIHVDCPRFSCSTVGTGHTA